MGRLKFASIWLCLLCIIVFILQSTFLEFTNIFVLSQEKYFEFWRLVSSIFLHGSITHLLYNLFALALFGTILESIIGYRKFISIFFLSGIFANLISIFFYNSSLGASGAIFGIIGVLVILRPKMNVFAFGIPMPMFLAAIFWILGDILGAVAFLSGNPMNNTGNIAHLSGAIFGLIIGLLISKNFKEVTKNKSDRIFIDETAMRDWENRFMR